jgi:hypothetical protein
MLAVSRAVRRWFRGAARHKTVLLIGLAITTVELVGLVGTSPLALVLGLAAVAYGVIEMLRPMLADRRTSRRIYTELRTSVLVPELRVGPYKDWAIERFGRWSAVHDPRLDAWLSTCPAIGLTIVPGTWRPQGEAEETRRLLAAAWPDLDDDGDKIRLCSDLGLRTVSVDIQRTKYSSFIVTNNLANEDLREPGRRTVLRGEDVVLHAGALPVLDNPDKCSNHVGVDVLACIGGDHLLVTKQSPRNMLSKGLWAPSGSGSADWADLLHDDLLATARGAMQREMSEELDLRNLESDIKVVGYARLEHLGGKPQFYGVARISAAVPGIRRSEERYVDDHHRIEFRRHDGRGGLLTAIQQFEEAFGDAISMPLHMNFLMLRQWLAEDSGAWEWLTSSRQAREEV